MGSPLWQGGPPSQEAVQGLVEAVSIGMYRVLALPHGSPLCTASFSPTDKLILTASAGGSVKVWSAVTGQLLRVLASPPEAYRREGKAVVDAAEFSPDGRTILTAGQGVLRLWDVATGNQIRRIERVSGQRLLDSPLCATFSPDGRTIAVPVPDLPSRGQTPGQRGSMRCGSLTPLRPIPCG